MVAQSQEASKAKKPMNYGGAEGDRTLDLRIAKATGVIEINNLGALKCT